MTSKPLINTADICGKPILVTDGVGGLASVEELRQYLRRFPTSTMLRFIGDVSSRLDALGEFVGQIEDVAVPRHCLPYLALLSIEASNDYRKDNGLDARAFARVVRVFNNLDDPLLADPCHTCRDQAGLELMIRLGKQQCDFQRDIRYLVPRTLLIFGDLWSKTGIPHREFRLDIQRICGLGLEELVLLGLIAYGQTGNDSQLRPIRSESIRSLPTPLRDTVQPERYAMLLKWLSASYSKIRIIAAKDREKTKIPGRSYDPYRFNPLQLYPLVLPESQIGPAHPTYIAPYPRWILERVTEGLYHELARSHEGRPGENPFKVAFGRVLEEYIGTLLLEAFGPEIVLREFKYGPKQKQPDSPDWLVVERDRAVVIEVKQSALFLRTKLWGHLDDVRENLGKTLLKASRQIARFENDIRAGVVGLERLSGLRSFEHLVVTYDNVHFANSLVRDKIAELERTRGIEPLHIHVCLVEELEYLLGHCWRGSLFDLLEKKRRDSDQDKMDFHDWMVRYLEPPGAGNPFLEGFLTQWLGRHGVRMEHSGRLR